MQAIPTGVLHSLEPVVAPRRKPTVPYPLPVTCDARAGDLPSGPKIEKDRMRIAFIGTGGVGGRENLLILSIAEHCRIKAADSFAG